MTQNFVRMTMILLMGLIFALPVMAADEGISDPLEPMNRVIFKFNNGVDYVILRPLAWGYHNGLPQYAQNRVHSALVNLQEPLSTVNYLLQGNLTEAGDSFTRFVLNSTFGLAGLFDVTDSQSDNKITGFGDTFGVWGIGPGPYLVLPIVGPSSVRDTAGLAANFYGDPVSLAVRGDTFDIKNAETVLFIRYGIYAVDARSRLLKQLDDLHKNSLDFYATMRSIYMQRRAAKLGDHGRAAVDDMSDYN